LRSLGLDPSLRGFGWAVFDNQATGTERRISSGHEETFPSTVPVARYVHYRSLVKRLLNTFEPDVVGIESPAYGAGPYQTVHHSLMMFCLEAIFESRKDVVLFDPATLKSLVRGRKSVRGLVTKLDMQKFVQFDTNDSELIDNNEADAYCISYFSTRFMSLKNGLLSPDMLSDNELRVFLEKTKKVKTLKGTANIKIAHIFRENSRFFEFSKIPEGRIDLPKKTDINTNLLSYLESCEGPSSVE